jgi:hypothetical protein
MVTVVLGSVHKTDERNPWKFHERNKMIKNVYSNEEGWKRMRVTGAEDIGDDYRWPSYILETVKDYYVEELDRDNYPGVDAYCAGSKFDAKWLQNEKLETIITDRTDKEYTFVSATEIRDMGKLQDDRWKELVHPANHTLVEKLFSFKAWDRL